MSTLSARILKEALDDCKLTIEDLRIFLPRTEGTQKKFDAFSKWKTNTEASFPSFISQDFRFRHLLLKNFRKFGDLPEQVYYGLLFEKKSSDKSELIDFLTLLGDNGVGKSSLVDSLEYLFTGNIGEAKIRQIAPTLYIRNKSGEKMIKVNMFNQEQIILDDDKCRAFRHEYDVSNFFFSENSILKFAEYTRRNGDNTNNWFPFFCYMLGIGALYDACSKDGILDQIKAEIANTKSEMASEDICEIRRKLQNLLRDGSIKISEKQRTVLIQLQTKLLNTSQDIKDGKIEKANFGKADFYNLTSFYFIQEFQKKYNDMENLPSSDSGLQGGLSKKIILGEKKSETGNAKKLLDAIEECLSHIQIVLEYGTGIVPLDDIKSDIQNLIRKEQSGLVVERHKTSEELDVLETKIEKLKENLLRLIHGAIVEYVDEGLVDAIKNMFDETFITEDEKQLFFNISDLKKTNKIFISVNDEPVHKYFNTFRYRLFCLTLQAILNIKLMKGENFLFPFIMDDVFYANDYRNKRELFKYFEQVRKYAKEMLGEDKKLQIIFFTHDEQIVSCFSTKFQDGEQEAISFARLTQPNFATRIKSNEVCPNGDKDKYYNLYIKLYE